jgi:signal peptidase II
MGKRFGLVAILIALDFLSKAIAFRELTSGGIVIIKNFFSLDLVFNTGVAWGLFDGHAGLWFGIRLILIAGLIYYFWRRASGWEGIFLSLVLAGALGNTLDYILYGKVVDFFHFTFWSYSFPIFNVADSCVTLGAIGLILWPTKHHNG